MFASILHYFRREAATALALAEEANRLATEQGFSFVFTQGQCQIGWALAEIGDIHRGLSLAAQGTQNFQATGAETAVPLLLGQLVEMYIMAGQPETALDILAEAFAVAARTQERIYEAELYRLQGMLFLMQERATEEVESCYQQALISARGRQDKAHELRAAISLSRLWRQQGECAKAYTLLAPIYSWFSEGLDTPDLLEAKALLVSLTDHRP
ncbi:hypothetical protein C2W62_40160 [Candidatus Entotheonella serta]|nr:hypothetical protein C2W62_40160 [Candidatus Entotheonella serta]